MNKKNNHCIHVRYLVYTYTSSTVSSDGMTGVGKVSLTRDRVELLDSSSSSSITLRGEKDGGREMEGEREKEGGGREERGEMEGRDDKTIEHA